MIKIDWRFVHQAEQLYSKHYKTHNNEKVVVLRKIRPIDPIEETDSLDQPIVMDDEDTSLIIEENINQTFKRVRKLK